MGEHGHQIKTSKFHTDFIEITRAHARIVLSSIFEKKSLQKLRARTRVYF